MICKVGLPDFELKPVVPVSGIIPDGVATRLPLLSFT